MRAVWCILSVKLLIYSLLICIITSTQQIKLCYLGTSPMLSWDKYSLPQSLLITFALEFCFDTHVVTFILCLMIDVPYRFLYNFLSTKIGWIYARYSKLSIMWLGWFLVLVFLSWNLAVWDVTPYSRVQIYWCFRENWSFHCLLWRWR